MNLTLTLLLSIFLLLFNEISCVLVLKCNVKDDGINEEKFRKDTEIFLKKTNEIWSCGTKNYPKLDTTTSSYRKCIMNANLPRKYHIIALKLTSKDFKSEKKFTAAIKNAGDLFCYSLNKMYHDSGDGIKEIVVSSDDTIDYSVESADPDPEQEIEIEKIDDASGEKAMTFGDEGTDYVSASEENEIRTYQPFNNSSRVKGEGKPKIPATDAKAILSPAPPVMKTLNNELRDSSPAEAPKDYDGNVEVDTVVKNVETDNNYAYLYLYSGVFSILALGIAGFVYYAKFSKGTKPQDTVLGNNTFPLYSNVSTPRPAAIYYSQSPSNRYDPNRFYQPEPTQTRNFSQVSVSAQTYGSNSDLMGNGAPPSYEEVNRPFQYYSGDKKVENNRYKSDYT